MLDLKIVGGTVVDGSGRPGFRGDVGVKDGRIVVLGEVREDANETVDATGLVVSPGFIDVHTHYDAQVFWEPTLSPSCYHGVTTVVGGFCGFSIAPVTPESAKYIRPMLARVEGMPLKTLEDAVPWNWSSFGEYLSTIDGRIGLNAGFFVGHSAIRRIVMGERAVGEKATPADLQKMKELLDQSLAEGGLGFSTTVSPSHNDGDGNPVPSRWADRAEIIELGRIVSQHEGTGLELLPDLRFGTETVELLTELSIAGNRPVNWNVLMINGRVDSEAIAKHQLEASDYARERGGEIIALTVPYPAQSILNLRTGFVFDALPGVWREMFKWPVEQRIAKFREPAFRRQMVQDAASVPRGDPFETSSKLAQYTFVLVHAEHNKKYEGRRVDDIAAEEGREPIDVLLDICIEDDLWTQLRGNSGGHDHASYELRGRLWADDRIMIGGSDAGAHLDLIDTFAFSTGFLEKGVREHKVIGLEQAVHKMTQRPAAYFGLIDRGTIAPGYHADLVVFDPATVGKGPTYNRHDVPGDNFRLYADARGISHVFVNGVEIVRNGDHTGKLPGTVLRSGQDTRTVPLEALRDEHSKRFAP